MQTTTITLHTGFQIGAVDPRIFGGFLEHMGRAVYEGVYDPEVAHADEDGFRHDVLDALAPAAHDRHALPRRQLRLRLSLDGWRRPASSSARPCASWPGRASSPTSSAPTSSSSSARQDGLDADDDGQPGHRHARGGAQLGRVLQLPARHANTPTCARPTAARSRTTSSCGAWATRWTAPGSSATSRPTSTPSARSRPPR